MALNCKVQKIIDYIGDETRILNDKDYLYVIENLSDFLYDCVYKKKQQISRGIGHGM